jgi:fermentation-respiration switch protein FrsA (DUF1100 family)
MLQKFAWSTLGILATLYISVYLLVRWGQTKLIFVPDRYIKTTPQEFNLNYQDVWIDFGKDKIHGWWIPSSKPTAPALLYFHGNASNNGDLIEVAAIFHSLDISVLLIDYRGYGRSSPIFPNETSVYQDAEAAWQYLVNKLGIEPENIFVYGHSLGGAIVIDLATRHSDMAGAIVEGTFTSMKDMAGDLSWLRIYPLKGLVTQHFDSISKINSLQTPLLILHGSEDKIVPVAMAKELFAAAPHPKQLVIIPQANHNNLPKFGDRQFLFTLQQFIQTNQKLNN